MGSSRARELWWPEISSCIVMRPVLALLLIALCLSVALSPWIWMAMRPGTTTSAWGTSTVSSWTRCLAQNISPQLRGKNVWVFNLIFGILCLYVYTVFFHLPAKFRAAATFAYFCCWLPSGLFLAFA